MSTHYILNEDKSVTICHSLTEWAEWFERTDRRVERTNVPEFGADVSTVFLGLDHQWGNGPPLLFETMIFGGGMDGYQERYSTWDEAVEGHARVVDKVKTQPVKE